MSEKYVDGVQQFATGTGTGALTLGNTTSARTRRMQDAGIGDGDTIYVRIQHAEIDAEWEIVKATYDVETGQITRSFDDASSSYTGSLISFSAGNKIVSGVMPARMANQKAQVVDTLADFRALTSAPDAVLIKGKDAAVDGWGGVFVRVAGSVAPDDEALVLRRTAGGDSYKRLLNAVVMDDNGDAIVTRDFTAGRNITVAGDVTIAGSLTKANNVESAGGAQSFTFYDAGGGVRNGVGTSTGRFDLRSVGAFGFYSGASANIIALLASGALTLSTTAGESLVLQSAGGDAYLRNQSGGEFYFGTVGLNLWRITAAGGHFLPESDNALNLGSASKRLGVLYAGTGTINTSGADSKMFISEADDAEKRAAARIKHLPRKYKFADAVERKGDAARWHFGYVAEDVRDALVAEGLDPHAYGFFCSDPIMKMESYFETATRPKMRSVRHTEDVVELRDGRPVLVRKTVDRPEPVGERVAVLDEQGQPVIQQLGANDDGSPIMAPLMHFVPEMEEYEEERTREVDTGEVRLGLRYSELEAFLRCAA